ncbi:MAG: hypothetical protein M1168_01030 [Candidatus Marsarchaeota archaeon]|nr:hypothetical protein [Candidatus Marsarchaeota archaeon]MCL5094551.1 hypothetical protein [Candidatus Marsarchaeota archaeon]
MKKQESAKSKEFDIIILISYIFTWVSGIIVFLISKKQDSKRKFHALQSILLGIIITIVGFIPFIGTLISLILWIYGIYIGYQGAEGRDIEIPYIGETAKKYSK